MNSLFKTSLPEAITSIDQAKKFLDELTANGEYFHPEDNANYCFGEGYMTPEQGNQLNKLMNDIYNLPGNDGRSIDLAFDPCEYLDSIS